MSVSTILKVKMKFSLQNLWNSVRSKWYIYTPVHCILNWCQLHHYHISYIIRKQEIINLATFSTHNRKKLLPNFSDYLNWNFPQSVVIWHVHLCITINHSLSLYHCREHKPTVQIINNWWLKYYFFLISSKYMFVRQIDLRTHLCQSQYAF